MPIRLDKFLSSSGEGSRSVVGKLIKGGRVQVDGRVVTDPAAKLDESSTDVFLDGRAIAYRKYFYFMMNKPKGVISATEDAKTGQKTVLNLFPEKYASRGLFPVGRLDIDTTGLLLLTNNGKFAHNTLSPKKHVYKTYYAEILGRVDGEDIRRFQEGLTLRDGYICRPAKLEIVESGDISKITVELSEGKFHQVKRMFEAVGKRVIELKRISFGPIKLDKGLAEGEFRPLSAEELALIEPYLL